MLSLKTARLCLIAIFISATVNADDKAALSRFVVVGDSLAAGFQNFSLIYTHQENSPAALIARQARVPLEQPLVPYPGVPNELQLVSPSFPPVLNNAPGSVPPIPRLNPQVQATNLAVPGHMVADALTKRPGPTQTDALTNIVLGFPFPFLAGGPALSQVERAVQLSPTFVLLWSGNNDALFAAITGDLSLLTPVANFAAAYTQASATLAATNAKMAIVNLPDVTLTPYFTSVRKLAGQMGAPVTLVANALGLQPDDYLRPSALAIALAILRGQQQGPLPFICPSTLTPFPQVACALRSSEAALIRGAIAAYNQVITNRARATGAALVDLDALVQDLASNGTKINGRTLTTEYLGGLFSLDGIHPTDTGYAIIANEILDQMKRQLNINVPKVNLTQVVKADPLASQVAR